MSDPCDPLCGGLTLSEQLAQAQECCAEIEERLELLELDALSSYPEVVSWCDEDAWDRFEEVSISGQDGDPPDNTIILTAEDCVGTATGSGGTHGNDRRVYLLEDSLTAADAEIRATFRLHSNSAQFGLALRTSNNEAIIAWSNVIFSASSNILHGAWEYGGNALISTNQMNSTCLNNQEILSASGDGSTVTVLTKQPHLLVSGGESVRITFGPFSATAVTATPVDATSFTFSNANAGAWTTGSWTQCTVGPSTTKRRHVAMRVIDDMMIVKHWNVGEPEPSWADPRRANFSVFPSTLEGSGQPPPTSGRFGIVINHMDGTRSLDVENLEIQVI
jgi:hypothetical protein